MKILIIVDKGGTAIDRLAQAVARNLPQHQIKVFPVHPKRNDVTTMIEAQKLMSWCDVLDIHYWKSGQILRTSFPKEFEEKPRLLFHFNPYDAQTEENQYYSKIIVGNNEIYNKVPSAYLVPYAIDLSFFKFNSEYTEDKTVNMSVARIEGKKGVLEVAQACKELGYKLKLVGRVSKAEYMREVMAVGGDAVEFWENATDEKLREIYAQSAIHVCNSVDDFESGTLPILEAMACGLPVLTRSIGHVPDIFDGGNMVVRTGAQNNVENLKNELQSLMENREQRLAIRDRGWKTVKNRDDRRMALEINKLYYQVYKPQIPLVSVIIPTKDNPESFLECLLGAMTQSYPKYEIVISDSGDIPVKQIVDEAQKHTEVPLRYMHFDRKGTYSLAEARNRAVIEADGEYLLFCDDRIKMDKEAIMVFNAHRKPKVWIWGMKDKVMKGFVENFSFVSRREFIDQGMFCERMQWYGGMTQEIRERFEAHGGFNFAFLQDAMASGIKRSKSKKGRMEDIIEAKYLIYKMYTK